VGCDTCVSGPGDKGGRDSETRIVGFYGDFEKPGFPSVAAAEKRCVCV
jgi:hypothetical protein